MSDKKTKSDKTLKDTQKDEEVIDAQEEAAQASSETGEAPKEEKSLEMQLEEAKKEAQESHDKMLRIAAECENLRKRMQRERETSLKYAEENILRELLPSIDNLERAMEQGKNADDVGALMQGVEMTRNGLLSSLEKFGLKPVESLGEPFDPNFHEALAMEASNEVPEQHILQVFEKGYLYKERLIRAAKVVVSKGDVKE